MSYLLYCIFRSTEQTGARDFPEFKGQPVFVASQHGLSAALSKLAVPDLIAGIPDLLAYENVIEFFYREQTVLPLQFGCKVGEVSEALALLAERESEYVRLLEQLEGMGEMGVHVLLDGADAATTPTGAGLVNAGRSSASSGAAYLAAKREFFLNLDQQALRQHRLADALCDALSGFFVRRKMKLADSAKSSLLSLCFLVRRECIDDFRQAACRFQMATPAKLLQSGPWPPFNFVDFLDRG